MRTSGAKGPSLQGGWPGGGAVGRGVTLPACLLPLPTPGHWSPWPSAPTSLTLSCSQGTWAHPRRSWARGSLCPRARAPPSLATCCSLTLREAGVCSATPGRRPGALLAAWLCHLRVRRAAATLTPPHRSTPTHGVPGAHHSATPAAQGAREPLRLSCAPPAAPPLPERPVPSGYEWLCPPPTRLAFVRTGPPPPNQGPTGVFPARDGAGPTLTAPGVDPGLAPVGVLRASSTPGVCRT